MDSIQQHSHSSHVTSFYAHDCRQYSSHVTSFYAHDCRQYSSHVTSFYAHDCRQYSSHVTSSYAPESWSPPDLNPLNTWACCSRLAGCPPPLRVDLPSHKLSCVQAAARQAPHSLISKGRAPWSWVNNPNLNWNWSLVSLSSSLQASCVSSSCSSVKYDSFKSPDCPAFLTCGRAASADLTDSWRRHRQQYSTVQCSTVLLTRLLFLLQLCKVELNSASVCHSLVVSVSASHPAGASSNPGQPASQMRYTFFIFFHSNLT